MPGAALRHKPVVFGLSPLLPVVGSTCVQQGIKSYALAALSHLSPLEVIHQWVEAGGAHSTYQKHMESSSGCLFQIYGP